MNTKIVYVLTSTEKDNYAEQAFVSVSTLRRHNKDVKVALVVDDRTEKTLTGVRHKLVDMVDELVVVQLPDNMTNKVRSRMLKTTLREHVRGDMLYVDVDTIIMGSLEDIDKFAEESGSLFGVWDVHQIFYNDVRKWENGLLSKYGLSIPDGTEFFNGGLCFAKDDEVAHDFYRKWHENYSNGLSKGVVTDQQSYAHTNMQMGNVMKRLPEVFNVQWEYGKKYWKDAKIFHYFAEIDLDTYHHFMHNPVTYERIKDNFEIPQEYWEMMGSVEAGMDFFQSFIDGLKRRKGIYSILNNLMKKFYRFRKII